MYVCVCVSTWSEQHETSGGRGILLGALLVLLVHIGVLAPRLELAPELVEGLDLLLVRVHIAELWHWLNAWPPAFISTVVAFGTCAAILRLSYKLWPFDISHRELDSNRGPNTSKNRSRLRSFTVGTVSSIVGSAESYALFFSTLLRVSNAKVIWKYEKIQFLAAMKNDLASKQVIYTYIINSIKRELQ